MARTPRRKALPAIGFLGVGKMGGAILHALLRAKRTRPSAIRICDAVAAREEQLVRDLGVKKSSAEEVMARSDVVFLAVKPQDLGPLLDSLPRDARRKPLVISIAAGRRIDWIEARLPGARVVRSMPNLGVLSGLGMTVYCGGSRVRKTDLRLAGRLLGSTGKACERPEAHLDAVTALSGSGPAFLAYVAQAMVEGATALGLDAQFATTLAVQTLLGTGAVLAEGDGDIRAFIRSVTSAKGTTAAGLAVLEKSALAGTMKRTLAAAARRSGELSRIP